jgi:hypothetical protein
MARQRDYKAEYARRIARGLAQGLSRSQARGHPRSTEAPVSPRGRTPKYEPQLEQGLKALREGKALSAAARSLGVAPERLRRYVTQTGVVEKRGRRWVVLNDTRPRRMQLYSEGKVRVITVPGYEAAARIGCYLSAVGQFLDDNEPAHLAQFVGESVRDVKGREYVFETRPNVLYRLAESGAETFEQVYRIVV